MKCVSNQKHTENRMISFFFKNVSNKFLKEREKLYICRPKI